MAQLIAFIETTNGELIAIPNTGVWTNSKRWQERLDESYRERPHFKFPSQNLTIPITNIRQYWIEEI